MIFVFAVAIFADVLPLPSPTDMDMLEKRAPFSLQHWLGTDRLGRDELSRLIYGARISLVVGICAPIIGLTLGGALGMLAGYFRGRFESLVVGSEGRVLREVRPAERERIAGTSGRYMELAAEYVAGIGRGW